MGYVCARSSTWIFPENGPSHASRNIVTPTFTIMTLNLCNPLSIDEGIPCQNGPETPISNPSDSKSQALSCGSVLRCFSVTRGGVGDSDEGCFEKLPYRDCIRFINRTSFRDSSHFERYGVLAVTSRIFVAFRREQGPRMIFFVLGVEVARLDAGEGFGASGSTFGA